MNASPEEDRMEVVFGRIRVVWLRNHPPTQAQRADNFQKLQLRLHTMAQAAFAMRQMGAPKYGQELLSSLQVGLGAHYPQLFFCTWGNRG